MEEYFNFDIEKMEEAMSEEGIPMPNFENYEDFEEWLDREE